MSPLVPVVNRRTGFKDDDQLVIDAVQRYGMSVAEAKRQLEAEIENEEIWVNETYQVAVSRFQHRTFGPCMQINIRRRDGNVIFRDWREFQDIKNQLSDPEFEAIEVYPAESRLVDTSNKYHLWVILDREFRVPFGWMERDVEDADPKNKLAGTRQRKLPPHWKPTNTKKLQLNAYHGRRNT